MNSPLKFFLLSLVVLGIGLNFYIHKNLPEPYNIFNNYGLKVGKTYKVSKIEGNPFESNLESFEATVLDIKGDYVKFDKTFFSSDVIRIGGIDSKFFNFKKIDE